MTAKKEEKTESTQGMKARLCAAQNEINARKSRYNKFGQFYYRNAEDILDAAKPVCLKHNLLLTVGDSLVLFNEAVYMKSTAKIEDTTEANEQPIIVEAFARIPAQRKGMDECQLTGAASTYARKYALNGLFCVDDAENEPDGMPNVKNEQISVDDAIGKLNAAKSRQEIQSIYNSCHHLQADSKFMQALQTACEKFPK